MNEYKLNEYLHYIGFSDADIENLDSEDLRFHYESKEYNYFSAGYKQAEKDLQELAEKLEDCVNRLNKLVENK